MTHRPHQNWHANRPAKTPGPCPGNRPRVPLAHSGVRPVPINALAPRGPHCTFPGSIAASLAVERRRRSPYVGNLLLPARTEGCELKSTKKEFTFEAEDDGADHMLVLRSVCLGGDATDEMHSVEVQSLDSQGRDVVATIATLKPSVQPSLALSGLDVEPPVTFKLKAGSGPIYISGQHYLEAMSDIDDDDEDDIDETPIVPSKKRARVTPKSQPMVSMKKPKLGDAHADDEDDDDDYEDDDFEVDDEEEEEEDEVLSKMTESGKKEGKRTPPKSPKTPLTLEDVKTKMKLQMDKGIKMPKKEDKFVNHIKNCFKIEDQKMIKTLWSWANSQQKA
uniref:Nucleophosmin n=1 Tax=Eptatretus burgeri TaxID=7764 RepID=A0A8C4QX71_EPTBU